MSSDICQGLVDANRRVMGCHITERNVGSNDVASNIRGTLELGGPLGCLLLMIVSHFVAYYIFLSIAAHDGHLFFPTSTSSLAATW